LSTKNSTPTFIQALLLAAGGAVYYLFLRPQMRKWGTRLGESQRRLPGDEIVPEPNFQMTHAVNIDAPLEAVWAWIAQMGRERTGYYSLDVLSNRGIPSVGFIRQDIPVPQPGMKMDGGFDILEVEPARKLLFGASNLQRLPGVVSDITALYLLERRRDGSTRLLVRRREFSHGTLGIIYNLIYEIIYFAFAVQQLRRLKRHAESMAHLTVDPATPAPDGRITV
jgi:preprotein translocase subunit YajC